MLARDFWELNNIITLRECVFGVGMTGHQDDKTGS